LASETTPQKALVTGNNEELLLQDYKNDEQMPLLVFWHRVTPILCSVAQSQLGTLEFCLT